MDDGSLLSEVRDSFDGQIFVSSSIVDYLSSGLYRSPAACLKELVNNSYDADARTTRVYVRPDANRIIVADDGRGFTRDEFVRHFSRISESHKRDLSERTPSGRPMIGKIGIGFIAANELCDEMRVLSTVEGSEDLLDITIDFARMRRPVSERRDDISGNVTKADYTGLVRAAPIDSHFTQVFLNRVRGEARSILAGATSQSGTRRDPSLYGLRADTVRGILCAQDFRAWSDFDTYSETMLRVGLNVPVRYHNEWLASDEYPKVEPFAEATAALAFSVEYDGSDLRKPIVFCPHNRANFVSEFEYRGTTVGAKGYFYAQHGSITPQDLNGVLIRIRDAAVGDYDPTFLDFPNSIGPLFQRWVSAEIWASDELEDAMNIDRRTLRVAHPAYEELRRAVHEHLKEVLARARAELHGEGSYERREAQASRKAVALQSVARRQLEPISRQAASRLVASWARGRDDGQIQRSLLRRYDVPEFYSIVIDVARETLAPDDLDRFVAALTKRLTS